MLKNKAALIMSSIGAAIFLYLAVSSPKGIVVSEKGDIEGILNIVRAEIQGNSFWKKQLQEVQDQIIWLDGQPERISRQNAKLARLEQKFEDSLQRAYEKYPKMRPSSAEQRADELRSEADKIEQEEYDEYIEQQRLKRIKKLQKLIPILISKL